TIDIYLRPKLSGKYADIHPMIFLVGFLGGPVVWGVAGFIVGPLVLGLAYAALEAYRMEGEE
ncbi:MAG: AI-2E family transporter, partial [Methanothermobacter sp.]|nr:AI-2E family transporter [Methanothermobacter sp.]